jgi:hypothetical protein
MKCAKAKSAFPQELVWVFSSERAALPSALFQINTAQRFVLKRGPKVSVRVVTVISGGVRCALLTDGHFVSLFVTFSFFSCAKMQENEAEAGLLNNGKRNGIHQIQKHETHMQVIKLSVMM